MYVTTSQSVFESDRFQLMSFDILGKQQSSPRARHLSSLPDIEQLTSWAIFALENVYFSAGWPHPY